MQKLEVVATHMQKVLSDIKILNKSSIDDLLTQLPLYYFDDNVIDYLNELSKELFKLNEIKPANLPSINLTIICGIVSFCIELFIHLAYNF